MSGEKRELLLTERKSAVMGIILGILKANAEKDEPFRIRKLHKQLTDAAKQMEKPASNCLIGDTIKMLVEAKILVPVEKKVAPGDAAKGSRVESILYDWDQAVFESHSIRIVTARPPKKPRTRKGAVVKASDIAPIITPEVTPQEWYTALIKDIEEMEATYALLGAKLAQLKAEKAEVDESIANVMKCFAQREGK